MGAGASILIFCVAIVLMIVAIARWKVHPFIAIITTALLLAIVMGIGLDEVPSVVGNGFASIFSSIGLVIIFGTMIGKVLEVTGAAVAMARAVERTVGRRHPRLAMMLIGWIVSIPVFCDSGFVLVNPIGRSLAQRTGKPVVSLTLALAAGLFAAHVFIPPTPGPVAAAGMTGLEGHLLLVVLVGAAVSVFALLPAYWFSGRIARSVTAEETHDDGVGETEPTDEAPRISAFMAFLPIVVPVVLMALGSVAALVSLPEGLSRVLIFLGKPVIALMVAVVCCIPLLARRKMLSRSYEFTQEALATAGPIIFITAAGAVLGNVMAASGFVDVIKGLGTQMPAMGVLLPFLIAAILKSAQGSSTVAITTTASMMGMFGNAGSLMASMGFTTPLAATLVVMAIGAGAMTVSHANDSYFWVVTGLGGIKPRDGYRTMTLMTLLMGLASLAALLLATLLL